MLQNFRMLLNASTAELFWNWNVSASLSGAVWNIIMVFICTDLVSQFLPRCTYFSQYSKKLDMFTVSMNSWV